jgi:lipopolysaccharide/colanic/teichoic acid biosynthesis glycosyltransferase
MEVQLQRGASFDDGLKRLMDVVGAAAGLLALAPVFLVVAVAIKLSDGGPVFYRANRVGRNGRPFQLYKFRSMRVGADRQGPGITVGGDARVTRVGRVLRRTKLDELPQLLNVLTGEMSLVGPRPEDARYVALYSEAQRRVLSVPPGITGAASLEYRDEESLLAGPDWEQVYRNEVMPAKLRIELEYLEHRSSWSDLGLIVRTVAALLPMKAGDHAERNS